MEPEWTKEYADKEVAKIEKTGRVPFYRVGDENRLHPFPLMSREEVNDGFRGLFKR